MLIHLCQLVWGGAPALLSAHYVDHTTPPLCQIVWGGQLHGGLRYNDLWLLPLSKEDEEGEGLMWCVPT